MRRLATAGLCLVLCLGACGSEDNNADVEKAVRDFVQATNNSDPRACDDFVTQRYLEQQTAQSGDAAREACREQLKTLGGVEVAVDKFERVAVKDDTAVVLVVLRSGRARDKRTITLAREDGRWRLDGGRDRR